MVIVDSKWGWDRLLLAVEKAYISAYLLCVASQCWFNNHKEVMNLGIKNTPSPPLSKARGTYEPDTAGLKMSEAWDLMLELGLIQVRHSS